jgi:hypothetical protein
MSWCAYTTNSLRHIKVLSIRLTNLFDVGWVWVALGRVLLSEAILPFLGWLFVFWAAFAVLFVKRVFPVSFCVAKSPKISLKVVLRQQNAAASEPSNGEWLLRI